MRFGKVVVHTLILVQTQEVPEVVLILLDDLLNHGRRLSQQRVRQQGRPYGVIHRELLQDVERLLRNLAVLPTVCGFVRFRYL